MSTSDLDSEAKILIQCARLEPDESQKFRLQKSLKTDPINWNKLLTLATNHALLPLLYWNLSRFASDLVPPETMRVLLKHFQMNTARNLFLARELTRLIGFFQEANVTVVPWRGPVLASSIYGNLALRYFSDLDVLARREDVLRIKQLLLEQGYQATLQLTEAEESALLKLHYTFDFDRHDKRAHIEVHWDIVPAYFHYNLDLSRLWQRLVPVTLNGSSLLTLSVEDVIQVQSVHNAKHQWERLAWICDFAEIIRACPGLDWQYLIKSSTESGSLRMVLLGLHLARELLDAPLPDTILKMIAADPKLPELLHHVRRGLLNQQEENTMPKEARFQRFHYQVREKFSDQLLYCARCLISPSIEDWGWIKFPAPLFFLYSVTRPFRLTGKYLRRFLIGHDEVR